MKEERITFSFSTEELKEAEELNALSNTRMTEEYKEFLRQELGDAEEPSLTRGGVPLPEPDEIFRGEDVSDDSDLFEDFLEDVKCNREDETSIEPDEEPAGADETPGEPDEEPAVPDEAPDEPDEEPAVSDETPDTPFEDYDYEDSYD